MKDSQGTDHYGDVWPLTAGLWQGVCDCGYGTTVRLTADAAKGMIEDHVYVKTGHYTPADIHRHLTHDTPSGVMELAAGIDRAGIR